MVARVSHTSVDSTDAYAQAQLRAAVLGSGPVPRGGRAGGEECMTVSPDGAQRLLLIRAPEAQQGENRVHLDLVPAEGTRDAELVRLVELGSTVVDDRRQADGTGWVVLADPEGDESCILRSDAERAAGPR